MTISHTTPPEEPSPTPLPKFVGLIHSEVKREYFPTEAQYITEKDAEHDASVIASYLEKMGIKAKLYPGRPEIVDKLMRDKPDMVFNLVDSVNGQEYLFAVIPGMLEALDIPYTGVGMLGAALACNKYLISEMLSSHNVPTPRVQLISDMTIPLSPDLRFPLISKLNEVHGAVEITKDAVSHDERHLRERLKFLISTYHQPVIVEEFIAGREYTAILLEGGNTKVYLAEKVFPNPDDPSQFATFDAQWVEGSESYTYAKVADPRLAQLVKKAAEVLRHDDYSKFDIRVDQSGRYYFIDSNCNPAFGPKELEVALSSILDMYDVSFTEVLKRLMTNTMRGWYKTNGTLS